MMAAFSITSAVPRARLDVRRQGQVAFTVTNTAHRDLAAQARVVAEDPADQAWFSVADPDRETAAGSTQEFNVQVAVPSPASAGSYRFRLDVVGVDDPDEDAGQGPWTSLEVPALAQPRRVPWRWVGAAAAAAVVLLVLLYLLVLRHPAQLSVTAGIEKFGTVAIGQSSQVSVITVSNTGSRPTSVSATVSGNDPQDFKIVAGTCGEAGLPAGATCQLQVSFQPSSLGSRSATLSLRDGSGASAPELHLSGRGRNTVVIGFDPATVALSDPTTGAGPSSVQRSLSIRNTGAGSLHIGSVTLVDTTGAFHLTSHCDGVTLAYGQACDVTVALSTSTITPQVLIADLSIVDDQPDSPQTVPLSGFRGQFVLARGG
jgi:P pilus assembly chaperone PapD